MPDNTLRIGAEFDVSSIVSGCAEASAAFEGLANKVTESREAMAGTSARAATAMEQEAAAHVEAASAGRSHAEANIQARLTTDALTGNISRAENALIRFASHSEAIGPIMQLAFAPLAIGIFADLIFHVAERMYNLYQNVVNARDELKAFGEVENEVAGYTKRLAEETESAYIGFLKIADPLEADREKLRSLSEQEFKFKIDDKQLKELPGEFGRFVKQLSDFPASEIDEQFQRLTGSIASLQEKLKAPVLRGTFSRDELEAQLKLLQDIQAAMTQFETHQQVKQKGGESELGKDEEEAEKKRQAALDAAARKQAEAAERAERLLEETQNDAARGAEQELRRIEEVERKKEEAARKAHELADQEAEYAQRMFEAIDAAAKKSAEEHERLIRQQAETDATIQARLDEAAERAAQKRAEVQKREMETVSRELERSIDGPLTKMIEGTERVSLAFRQMGQRIVISMLEAFEKMLIHYAVHEAQMLILHVTSNEARVASDASAAAQTKTIETTLGLKQVIHAAAVAAAKTWAAVAEIPIVGPFIAPAAAAAAFAGVVAFESLAAAEEGAYVPRTQPVLAHAGEIILNPQQTRDVGTMAKSFNEGGGGGGNIAIHAFDSKSIASFLHGNQSAFLKMVRNAVRNGQRFK